MGSQNEVEKCEAQSFEVGVGVGVVAKILGTELMRGKSEVVFRSVELVPAANEATNHGEGLKAPDESEKEDKPVSR